MSTDEQGDENMVLREEEVKKNTEKTERRTTITRLANKVCDRNDDALRRLSKN